MHAKKVTYHLLALLVVAIWGMTFISTKVLINNGLEPAWIFLIRFVMAYAGIWALTALKGGKTRGGKLRLWSRTFKDEAVFILLGVSGGSLYFLTENSALAYTRASNVAFIVCTAPLLTAIFTILYRRRFHGPFAQALEPVRMNWALIAGTVLSLLGVGLLSFEGAGVQMNARGDLLALCAAIFWGIYSLFINKMTDDYGELFATRKVFFWGLVTIIPILAAQGGSAPSWQQLLHGQVLWNLLFLGIVASLVCYVVWNRVMAELGNVTATDYVYLNPLFTLVGAMILLGERLTLLSAIGSASIILGVFIAGKYNKYD